MSSRHNRSTSWLVFLSSLIQAVDARNTTYFDRNQCLSYVIGLQSEPGWSKNTGAYFAGSQDALLNGTNNMTLTLRGCEQFCGPRSFYWDDGPRLVTWIVPVMLLLSNIELSPIDKKRFMTIIHALGDPIDSFQLNIIDQYASRESEEEETDLVVGSVTDSRTSLLSRPARNPIHNASIEMQDFKPKKAQEIPKIKTDIQISMPTKRQTKVGLIRHSTWDEHFLSLQWLGAIYTYRPWKVQYMYVDHRTHAKRNSWLMAFAGLFPVLVSAVGASAILWYAVPPGFSCRSVWAVAIFVLWIFSALITTAVYVYSDRKGWIPEEEAIRSNTKQTHVELGHGDNEEKDKESRSQKDPAQKLWTWVLIKDAVIAAACVVVIFLSTAGMFNSCYCWSVDLTRKNNPVVPLNTDKSYEENAIKIYSGVVIVCIGVQVLFVFAITWYWSGGLRVVRWSEKDKRTEWAHKSEETVMWTEKS